MCDKCDELIAENHRIKTSYDMLIVGLERIIHNARAEFKIVTGKQQTGEQLPDDAA